MNRSQIVMPGTALAAVCLTALFGCTQSALHQPVALMQTNTPTARGSMAADLDASAPLRITTAPAASAKPTDSAYTPAAVTQLTPATTTRRAQISPAAQPAGPSPLRRLQEQAAAHFAGVSTYVARMHRREQVGTKDGPDEWLLFKWRRQPWSVYFQWIGPASRGREVLYVQGQHGGQLHTRLAAGDMPLMPAGKHLALDLDNRFVRSASRHAITDAGIGNLVVKYGRILDSQEQGQPRYGTLRYARAVRRPEYRDPMETVEQTIPPQAEAALPRGGRRWWLFDPASHLPVLVITVDDRNHEVEYYCYDQVQENVRLGDADFDPTRWDGRPGRR